MKRFVVAAGIVTGLTFGAPAMAQTKPTIPVIVKATTSIYCQTVLAGARKAGQDFDVNVTELGAQSESDVAGQISLLEKAVASNPTAIVIAPAQFAPLGKPIDEAAKKVKIIGINSTADTKALTSFLATDDVQVGHIAADALANAITRTYADTEGDVAIITASSVAASPDQSVTGFKEQVAKKYRALNVLPEKVADAQAATGLSIMKDLTATDMNLRGVFVSNIIMAEGRAKWSTTSRPETGSITSSSARTTNSSNHCRTARSTRSLCRTRSAWVTMGSRPRLLPREARRCRPLSIPAPTSSPRLT